MAWSTWQSDNILDDFVGQPGTTTIIGPGHVARRKMTNAQAQQTADAIQQRAAERNITVKVMTREIAGNLGHSEVIVRHVIEEG
jgi:hypothetical protein